MGKHTCYECQKEFESEKSLHLHFKAHKMGVSEYYQKHFPRYDKWDGTIIKFGSRDSYFNTDFNSREHLAFWLKKVSDQECRAYLTEWFIKRKRRKNLTYAPTQVELRTLPVPGMSYLDKLFGSYVRFVEDLDFKVRFSQVGFNKPLKQFEKGHCIIVDSREQVPLSFNLKTQVEKLEYGDYRLNDDTFTDFCYIERKNVNDFYGTLLSGYGRFKKELERAQKAKVYLIILVEDPLKAVEEYSNTICRMTQGIRISPQVIYHNMRSLIQQFPNIQFLFVNNRDEASKAIATLFRCNGEFRYCDLQYLYDTGKLI